MDAASEMVCPEIYFTDQTFSSYYTPSLLNVHEIHLKRQSEAVLVHLFLITVIKNVEEEFCRLTWTGVLLNMLVSQELVLGPVLFSV